MTVGALVRRDRTRAARRAARERRAGVAGAGASRSKDTAMAARDGPRLDSRGGPHPGRLPARWLVPAVLLVALAVVSVMIASSLGRSDAAPDAARDGGAAARGLRPYWTVRPGQTYAQIAQRTGLSVDQLETFNPYVDPTSLVPGQRIKLRLHTPPPPPPRLGPRYWTVRTGESFGSIAARTGHRIATLQRLNPRLKPTDLQPGDRVRLRR
jgi:LysM repeat protein